jgi:hypothetical protein
MMDQKPSENLFMVIIPTGIDYKEALETLAKTFDRDNEYFVTISNDVLVLKTPFDFEDFQKRSFALKKITDRPFYVIDITHSGKKIYNFKASGVNLGNPVSDNPSVAA